MFESEPIISSLENMNLNVCCVNLNGSEFDDSEYVDLLNGVKER